MTCKTVLFYGSDDQTVYYATLVNWLYRLNNSDANVIVGANDSINHDIRVIMAPHAERTKKYDKTIEIPTVSWRIFNLQRLLGHLDPLLEPRLSECYSDLSRCYIEDLAVVDIIGMRRDLASSIGKIVLIADRELTGSLNEYFLRRGPRNEVHLQIRPMEKQSVKRQADNFRRFVAVVADDDDLTYPDSLAVLKD